MKKDRTSGKVNAILIVIFLIITFSNTANAAKAQSSGISEAFQIFNFVILPNEMPLKNHNNYVNESKASKANYNGIRHIQDAMNRRIIEGIPKLKLNK